MSEPCRVSTTVDFEGSGKQFGALNVPYSSNESAWGAVRIPIVVIKGGAGPTLLCTGGVHGDEYEGPIALGKLARGLEAAELDGGLILLPALNLPAVLAGARVSPIDQINLNRAFPGRWDGRCDRDDRRLRDPAHPAFCDAVLDLHSGGRTLQFLPFCGMHVLDDAAQMARTRAAMLAFGAPFSVIIDEFDRLGMLDTAVEQLGKVFLFTELGGGGAATAATVAIAERGIQNLLRHLGMIEGAPENAANAPVAQPGCILFRGVRGPRHLRDPGRSRSRGCGRSADRPGARRREPGAYARYVPGGALGPADRPALARPDAARRLPRRDRDRCARSLRFRGKGRAILQG